MKKYHWPALESKDDNGLSNLLKSFKRGVFLLGILIFTGIVSLHFPRLDEEYFNAADELFFLTSLYQSDVVKPTILRNLQHGILNDSDSFYYRPKLIDSISRLLNQDRDSLISKSTFIHIIPIINQPVSFTNDSTVLGVYSELNRSLDIEYPVPKNIKFEFSKNDLVKPLNEININSSDLCYFIFNSDSLELSYVEYEFSCSEGGKLGSKREKIIEGGFESNSVLYEEGVKTLVSNLNEAFSDFPSFAKSVNRNISTPFSPSQDVSRHVQRFHFLNQISALLHEIGDYKLDQAIAYTISKSQLNNIHIFGIEIPYSIIRFFTPLTVLTVIFFLVTLLAELDKRKNKHFTSLNTYFPFFQNSMAQVFNLTIFYLLPILYFLIFYRSQGSFYSVVFPTRAILVQYALFILILYGCHKIYIWICKINGLNPYFLNIKYYRS